jgi:hypothetical protein
MTALRLQLYAFSALRPFSYTPLDADWAEKGRMLLIVQCASKEGMHLPSFFGTASGYFRAQAAEPSE